MPGNRAESAKETSLLPPPPPPSPAVRSATKKNMWREGHVREASRWVGEGVLDVYQMSGEGIRPCHVPSDITESGTDSKLGVYQI